MTSPPAPPTTIATRPAFAHAAKVVILGVLHMCGLAAGNLVRLAQTTGALRLLILARAALVVGYETGRKPR